MITSFRKPPLACFVAAVIIFYIVTPATAGMIQSRMSPSHEEHATRSADMVTIRLALESRMVQEKLKAYGVTDEEVQARLQSMTEDEIHLLAQASERVLAGGDGFTFGITFAIGVLVVVLLVIMILKLIDKEIIIR